MEAMFTESHINWRTNAAIDHAEKEVVELASGERLTLRS
jgi:hypothetical protein